MFNKKKTIKIKVCPRCESRNIELLSPLGGWMTPEVYICLKCGYRGPIILEIEIDPSELKNEEGN